jgi:hypothetical protein
MDILTEVAHYAAPIIAEENKELTETETEEDSDTGDDEFPDEHEEIEFVACKGEEVVLPWMPSKYPWNELINESIFPELAEGYKHSVDVVELSPNMMTLGKKVALPDVQNRMSYLGLKETKENFRQTVDEINKYKKAFQDTISIIISNFMLEIARKLHFADDEHGNGVKDWDDFMLAIESSNRREDGKKIVIIVYLIFDWMKHFQQAVSDLVMKIHNVTINSKSPSLTKKRRPKSFINKMVTQGINAIRKAINKNASEHSGFKYTITRYGEELENVKDDYDNRTKRFFYEWMVWYDPVSWFGFGINSFLQYVL